MKVSSKVTTPLFHGGWDSSSSVCNHYTSNKNGFEITVGQNKNN